MYGLSSRESAPKHLSQVAQHRASRSMQLTAAAANASHQRVGKPRTQSSASCKSPPAAPHPEGRSSVILGQLSRQPPKQQSRRNFLRSWSGTHPLLKTHTSQERSLLLCLKVRKELRKEQACDAFAICCCCLLKTAMLYPVICMRELKLVWQVTAVDQFLKSSAMHPLALISELSAGMAGIGDAAW